MADILTYDMLERAFLFFEKWGATDGQFHFNCSSDEFYTYEILSPSVIKVKLDSYHYKTFLRHGENQDMSLFTDFRQSQQTHPFAMTTATVSQPVMGASPHWIDPNQAAYLENRCRELQSETDAWKREAENAAEGRRKWIDEAQSWHSRWMEIRNKQSSATVTDTEHLILL